MDRLLQRIFGMVLLSKQLHITVYCVRPCYLWALQLLQYSIEQSFLENEV